MMAGKTLIYFRPKFPLLAIIKNANKSQGTVKQLFWPWFSATAVRTFIFVLFLWL
jgi:hypothetical protein